jgi:hypothetical protein
MINTLLLFVFKGLILPPTLDINDVAGISLAYACQTCDALTAQARIAEAQYRQLELMAKSYMLSWLKAQEKAERAAERLNKYCESLRSDCLILPEELHQRQACSVAPSGKPLFLPERAINLHIGAVHARATEKSI